MYTSHSPYHSILMVTSGGVSDFRMTLAARYLRRSGYVVEVTNEVEFWQLSAHDLFIIQRPGPTMLGLVKACLDTDKRLVIDMDDDFFSIPRTNPAYPYVGGGADNGNYLRDLRKYISDPRVHITVASPELLTRFERDGEIMPNPWDDENPRWKRERKPDGIVTIGWAGTSTHWADFQIVLPALQQVLNEFDNTRLMIGGDHNIYNLFDLPDARKLFIPPVPYDTYPVMPMACDIWLAPLVDDVFNRAKSDIKLVDAAAAGIPFVASCLPQYVAWDNRYEDYALFVELSGALAHDPDDWYDALYPMVTESDLRAKMGENAKSHANQRTATEYGRKWEQYIKCLIE